MSKSRRSVDLPASLAGDAETAFTPALTGLVRLPSSARFRSAVFRRRLPTTFFKSLGF